MADAWERRGRAEREQRPVDLGTMALPWSSTSADDRVAAGLARLAGSLEPHNFRTLDRRVLVAQRLRVETELGDAVAATARALPAWDLHEDLRALAGDRRVLDAFWSHARDARAPMLPEERRRFYLGTLAVRLGKDDDAEAEFRAALSAPGGMLNRAELSWHLGELLLRKGRDTEALELLSRAEREPVFQRAVRVRRAEYFLEAGRPEEAMPDLEALLTAWPGEERIVLRYASAALATHRFEEAADRLRRAIGEHPGSQSLRKALVEALVAGGELPEAERAVQAWRRDLGDSPALAQARHLLETVAGAP
jgi:predicted Zn-dependent protease